MLHKRPSAEDEPDQIPRKQPRQLEPYSRLVSALEFPCEATFQSFHASGKDDNNSAKCKTECDKNFDCVYIDRPYYPKKDIVESTPYALSYSLWASGSSSEEDTNYEAPFHILSSPDLYNFECTPRTHIRPMATSYPVRLDNPPRKFIPIGPEFQADVPEWGRHGNLPLQDVKSVQIEVLNYKTRLAGSVVIGMQDPKPLNDNEEAGAGRNDCACKDTGSTRCVRQHVLEAREKLKRTIGNENFADLGFGDMGEVVADDWSDEEEQLFHEVVFSCPPLFGKNFWDHLAIAFPSRTKKEIVSYYFNVFMLRRRAEQNRFNPMNVDSDNDEWEGTDDSADSEAETEDNDNAPVESPEEPFSNESFDRNAHGYGEEYCSGKNVNALKESHSNGTSQASDETGGLDIQDGSCTSDYSKIAPKLTVDKNDGFKQRTGQFSGMSGARGFVPEACNAREWDCGYLSFPMNDFELLPTRSMIEEVFGAGSWNYKPGDGR